eukprot:6471965-Amphidinium_carterae.1
MQHWQGNTKRLSGVFHDPDGCIRLQDYLQQLEVHPTPEVILHDIVNLAHKAILRFPAQFQISCPKGIGYKWDRSTKFNIYILQPSHQGFTHQGQQAHV